jgi:hypothetical protein
LWGASTPFLNFYLKKIGICFPTKKKLKNIFVLEKNLRTFFPKEMVANKVCGPLG